MCLPASRARPELDPCGSGAFVRTVRGACSGARQSPGGLDVAALWPRLVVAAHAPRRTTAIGSSAQEGSRLRAGSCPAAFGKQTGHGRSRGRSRSRVVRNAARASNASSAALARGRVPVTLSRAEAPPADEVATPERNGPPAATATTPRQKGHEGHRDAPKAHRCAPRPSRSEDETLAASSEASDPNGPATGSIEGLACRRQSAGGRCQKSCPLDLKHGRTARS